MWGDFLRDSLDSLKQRDLYRRLKTITSEQGPWVELEGKRVLNLCSNNYLGLAAHPKVKEAAAQAAYEYGCGSGASRLICGNLYLHEALEQRLAAFKGTEAVLAYSTGYMANLGIISALVGRGDTVLSDELNHASIVDGCRLSRAEVRVYPHNDLGALEAQLHATVAARPDFRRLIVVDAVFGMDGGLAPLPELVELAGRYDAMLMVDEAHATGCVGPGGRGLVAHFCLEGQVPVIMGTLGKALGSFGAFAAGSRLLREYLVNLSRSLIFTTGLPPSVPAGALAALDILEADPSLVATLQDNAAYLRHGLQRLGYDTLASQTQIMPIVIGDARRTVEMSRLLLESGVLATAIRPPTVPEGTSRIRVTVMANHTRQDLDFALAAFEKAGRKLGLI
ncbi:MAG: 8-amino-7-oxononanoate synthase [Chloroflexi bacterium]|nr:8-amino-7-oxononanoate synthase [Chloroflexota bacterium]